MILPSSSGATIGEGGLLPVEGGAAAICIIHDHLFASHIFDINVSSWGQRWHKVHKLRCKGLTATGFGIVLFENGVFTTSLSAWTA